MAVEIERKFLVVGDAWRPAASRRERLRDGLIAASDGRKVRVRLYEGRATLAVKSKRHGGVRAEFEYDIPVRDAEELLAQHCGPYVVEKVRHSLRFQDFAWDVDEYEGLLRGVVIAEIELRSTQREIPLPDWVGAEITDNPDYRKINMLNAALEKA